jgi:glycosyltransferase involved in cell wall biosynthesis
MRIAAWYNVPAGGAKRALYDHIEALSRRGHHIEVWCPPTAEREFLPLAGLVDEHVVDFEFERPPPWWTGSRIDTLRSAGSLMKALCDHSKACAEQMESAGFDVYLATTCQFFGSPAIGRFLRGPSVLYLQEPHRWLYEASPDLPWLAASRAGGRRLARRVRASLEAIRIQRRSERARFEVDNARAFDKLLVNSLFSRETVLRLYGVDAEVCYLGVDTKVFRPTGVPREDLVIGVGALAPHKNARLLVEAVGLLPQPRPNVVWVGAGRDERYAAEVAATAVRLDVALTVYDRVDDQTLVDLLNRSRVLVYTPRLEPFGLVPLEANACELAVVATAEGGVRETVLHEVNGLLVDPWVDQIAAAIDRIQRDKELAERLGRDGRSIVEAKWTLDAAAARLEEALESVTTQATARRPNEPRELVSG